MDSDTKTVQWVLHKEFWESVTSMFFKKDSMRQKENSKVGLPRGNMQLGPGAGYGKNSLALSPCSVLSVSVFDTLEPPSADWWSWLWDWIGSTQLPTGLHVLKALDTNQAVAAPRLSTALQLPQKLGDVYAAGAPPLYPVAFPGL